MCESAGSRRRLCLAEESPCNELLLKPRLEAAVACRDRRVSGPVLGRNDVRRRDEVRIGDSVGIPGVGTWQRRLQINRLKHPNAQRQEKMHSKQSNKYVGSLFADRPSMAFGRALAPCCRSNRRSLQSVRLGDVQWGELVACGRFGLLELRWRSPS